MGAYQDFLNQYTKKDGKISRIDIREFAAAGGSQDQAKRFLEKASQGNKGYDGKVGEGAYEAANKDALFASSRNRGSGSGSSGGGGSGGASGGGGGNRSSVRADRYYGDLTPGITPAMFDRETGERLEELRGTNQVNYANAVSLGNQLVQSLINESNDYATDASVTNTQTIADANYDIAEIQATTESGWRSYLADVQAENNLAMQGLRNQGALDLQEIVNTGLRDVADIQGSYASERVRLQGEYDVERANIQADFEKFKAARQKEGQMYGSLFAGFWS